MRMEKIGTALFIVAIVFLSFAAGAVLMASKTPPYLFFHDAYKAGEALVKQHRQTSGKFATDQWQRTRRSDRGVTVNLPQAEQGYTLFTSSDAPVTSLIAMDGRLVHEWRRPFSAAWDENISAVAHPVRDDLVYMHKARLYPNGDLLVGYTAGGDTPWGYGLAKLDINSKVLWSYQRHAHHDFDVAPDGRVFTLTHDLRMAKDKELWFLDRPYLADDLVVLSPDGKETAKFQLVELMKNSRFRGLFDTIPFWAVGDPLHANAVQYIDAEKARNFPFGKEGDVLLSFRNIGVLAVLDMRRKKIVWATRGPWLGQHDPSILANGQILLFDNLGGFEPGNESRVLQFDPGNMDITWSYTGDAKAAPFASPLRSMARRLANGDTLITETDGGRIFEVNRAGKIVWEYVSPIRRGKGDELIPILSAAQRVDPQSLDRDFYASLEKREQRKDAAR